MARMMVFVMIAFTISIILHFTGLVPSNDTTLTTTGFTNIRESNSGINSFSAFYTSLFGGAGATGILIGLGVGIIASLLTRGAVENFIVLPFITGTLGLFLGTFYSVIFLAGGISQDFLRIPITLLAGAFSIGYIITMVEFFRGNV